MKHLLSIAAVLVLSITTLGQTTETTIDGQRTTGIKPEMMRTEGPDGNRTAYYQYLSVTTARVVQLRQALSALHSNYKDVAIVIDGVEYRTGIDVFKQCLISAANCVPVTPEAPGMKRDTAQAIEFVVSTSEAKRYESRSRPGGPLKVQHYGGIKIVIDETPHVLSVEEFRSRIVAGRVD